MAAITKKIPKIKVFGHFSIEICYHKLIKNNVLSADTKTHILLIQKYKIRLLFLFIDYYALACLSASYIFNAEFFGTA